MPNSHGNKLYIGLDGGQSETFAVICGGDGKLLGTGRSGGCILGSALCGDNIAAAVSEALAEAGLAADTIFNGAVFGLSGGFDMINIGDYVCARNKKAVWDAEIALAGAAGGAAPDDSALIIAGTGSVAIGKPFGGGFTRCGGWGYVLHDPGSGCEIGRQVFEEEVRDTDGRGPKTALTGLLLSHFGADNLLEVKKLTYECNPLHVFPPLAAIFETACIMGDSEALRIGYKAGEVLAALAVGLTVKGGVAKNCRVYRQAGCFISDHRDII